MPKPPPCRREAHARRLAKKAHRNTQRANLNPYPEALA